METPEALIVATASKTVSCIIGDNPAEGSSRNSTSGSVISARPMATTCRSPPESEPAFWALRSRSSGNSSVTDSDLEVNSRGRR
jgi:hypothetical protein